MNENKIDSYIEGQEVLIKDIKKKLLYITNNSTEADILFDIVNLLKNIKPISR